ncbi:hypothetical protein BH10PSE17_BH10PSE17_23660 [soil metagenome]
MATNLLKISAAYLLVAVLLGMSMGMAHNFALVPVHAHVGVLGWATLALAGVIYHLYPAAALTRLAKVHFWLHNIGLPMFMIGLGVMLTTGNMSLQLVLNLGALLVVIGVVCFVINVFINVKASARA